MTNEPKMIREIDDLRLVPCRKHRDAVIGCLDCKVVIEPQWYALPEKMDKDQRRR
jgi:hypothetical protein